MQFLNYINLCPITFMRTLEQSSDVEILNKIQDLMGELQHCWKNGIPEFKEQGCKTDAVEAKKELLTALLNEYQVRLCAPISPTMNYFDPKQKACASVFTEIDSKKLDKQDVVKLLYVIAGWVEDNYKLTAPMTRKQIAAKLEDYALWVHDTDTDKE